MLEVPEKYRTMAKSDAREVSVKVMIGSVELTNDDIIELNIYRSLGENGFGIGGTVTARVRLLCVMTLPYTGTISMEVYVRFGFNNETASDYVQLGRFYGQVSNPTKKNTQIEIIGYDKLGSSGLSARCTFAAVENASLTFPCTAQEMLEYVCARKNIETEIVCNDYTIPEMPVKDKTKDTTDYERYYTYGEIISFIAAAHGANAAIDSSGKLVFLSAKQSEEQVKASDCIDFSLTTAERFTVKGILLHVQDTLSTGSTNIFINDDSKEAYDGEIYEGVVEASCCFGSIEIAEALWGQLGGFAYNSCEFTRRGCGWTELGDVISVTDDMRVDVYGKNVSRDIMVQTVEWSFSAANGFMEHIISKADSSEESAERLGSNNTINNSGGGVGEFTIADKTSEIFNCYSDVKNESGSVMAKKNYINPKTSYSHVAGKSNAIDRHLAEESQNSEYSSVLGGAYCYIDNSIGSAIVCGNGNRIRTEKNKYLSYAIIGAGVGNIIKDSSNASILNGDGNTIDGAIGSTILTGIKNIISAVLNGMYSVIVAGYGCTIKDAQGSTIVCGQFNGIVDASNVSIISGENNSIERAYNSAIVTGHSNSISDTNNQSNGILCGEYQHIQDYSSKSAIICGNDNSILNSNKSCVLSGSKNSIRNTLGSVIFGGKNNSIGEKNNLPDTYSTAVYGETNITNFCNNTIIFGTANTVDGVNDSLIVGKGHKIDPTVYAKSGRLFCGQYGTFETQELLGEPIPVFAVGGGTSSDDLKNVAYIDEQGNVYAKSFNIIGAEAAAASVASEEAAQPSDISALARQVSQMQAEIEALKSEIAQLKGAAS